MSLDPKQVADAVAEALRENPGTAEQVLRELFLEHAKHQRTQNDWSDWNDVKQILESPASSVGYDQVDPLLTKLKELAGETGDAEQPRDFFGDYELQNYYAPVPVVAGSAIYQAGEAFYLYPGEDSQVQLWKAQSADGSAYYYDDAGSTYGEYGEPLGAPGDEQPQQEDHEKWNGFLREYGPSWDGTEESWQQFRVWFLHYADQNQVGRSAQGFIALAESGDKREVFISYGITPPAADPAAGHAASVPMPAEMRAHLDAVLAENPHLAEILSDEHIRPVIEELLSELSS